MLCFPALQQLVCWLTLNAAATETTRLSMRKFLSHRCVAFLQQQQEDAAGGVKSNVCFYTWINLRFPMTYMHFLISPSVLALRCLFLSLRRGKVCALKCVSDSPFCSVVSGHRWTPRATPTKTEYQAASIFSKQLHLHAGKAGVRSRGLGVGGGLQSLVLHRLLGAPPL